MPEISDLEARELRGAKALLDKMLANPKTKRATEKLVKEIYPDAVTTDDVVEPYVSEIKELRKEFNDYVKGVEGSRLDSRLNQDIERLKSERSFTDDGIEKLKKLMIEKQIPDMIVAADHWERQNPPTPQEPSVYSPSDWGFGRNSDKNEDLALLYKDEDAWAEREARKVWAEEQKKRGQIVT